MVDLICFKISLRLDFSLIIWFLILLGSSWISVEELDNEFFKLTLWSVVFFDLSIEYSLPISKLVIIFET